MRDLFPPKPERKPKPERTSERKIVAVYPYVDESGNVLFEVVRYEPKTFAQRRPDGQGGYIWNLNGVRRVLYKLPDVLRAVAVGRDYLYRRRREGRGCALWAWLGGHDKSAWRGEMARRLLRDAQGRSCSSYSQTRRAWSQARGVCARNRCGARQAQSKLWSCQGTAIKDVSDWLRAGGTKEQLQELVAQAQEWRPAPAVSYEELRATFEKWLALPDDLAIRFVLSAVIANRLSGDPLWAFIVGPSGSSKTEIVNPLTTLEFVRPLDQLTTNTFLSGKQKKDPNASACSCSSHTGRSCSYETSPQS
jgi:hypothetical protein